MSSRRVHLWCLQMNIFQIQKISLFISDETFFTSWWHRECFLTRDVFLLTDQDCASGIWNKPRIHSVGTYKTIILPVVLYESYDVGTIVYIWQSDFWLSRWDGQEGNRPLERPRHRLVDNIKVDFNRDGMGYYRLDWKGEWLIKPQFLVRHTKVTELHRGGGR
jgi:hypothetical protein